MDRYGAYNEESWPIMIGEYNEKVKRYQRVTGQVVFQCKVCGEYGHNAASCYMDIGDQEVCDICGSFGHYYKTCPCTESCDVGKPYGQQYNEDARCYKREIQQPCKGRRQVVIEIRSGPCKVCGNYRHSAGTCKVAIQALTEMSIQMKALVGKLEESERKNDELSRNFGELVRKMEIKEEQNQLQYEQRQLQIERLTNQLEQACATQDEEYNQHMHQQEEDKVNVLERKPS